MKIPLMKKVFYKDAETRVRLAEFVLTADRLSMGEQCQKFEKEFATWHQRKHAILFNSGASANLALLQALKNMQRLKANDAVGFSALTWSTNVMPIMQMGFHPVPIDCQKETLNVMSKNLLDTLKTENLKCLFITNALGFSGDLYNIEEICAEKGIILLEDNCESLGTVLYGGRLTGNFSLASTFSFFVGHHLSTIEGGMILTDDDSLENMLRMVRANGWDRNVSEESKEKLRLLNNVSSDLNAKYTFYDLAFNLRPTEVTGFLGCTQLPHLTELIYKRQDNYHRIRLLTERFNDFMKLSGRHLDRISAFALPFIFTNGTRDKFLKKFNELGIEVRPIIAGNIMRQPFFKKYCSRTYNLPNTEFIHENGFYCANRPDFSEEDIETIKEALS